MSHRVAKRVYVYDPNASPAWVLTKDRRFIWDGWLMLREIDQDAYVVQTYLWGLDLVGQVSNLSASVGPVSNRSGSTAFLTQAGGIGGLVAVNIAQPEPNTPSGTFIYCYDGNGNVTQLVRPINGTLSAKYDYDPYGTRINAAAAGEAVQPWRFSTKQFDAETGLQYYGLRYRDRERWISRDPIQERGGALLYAYVGNNPVGLIDPLGQSWQSFFESAGRIAAAAAAGAASGAVSGFVTGALVGACSPPVNAAAALAGGVAGLQAGAIAGSISAGTKQAAIELTGGLSGIPPTLPGALEQGAVTGLISGITAGAVHSAQMCCTAANISTSATVVSESTRGMIAGGASGLGNFAVEYVRTGDLEQATLKGALAIPLPILGTLIGESGDAPKLLISFTATLVTQCAQDAAEFWEGW